MGTISKLVTKLKTKKEGDTMTKGQEVADVTVDYPKEGELITSPDYVFRIGARPTHAVEISIDGGEWQPCRQAGGYWWFDWSGYKAGKHQAAARIQPENGDKATLETRRFRVELS